MQQQQPYGSPQNPYGGYPPPPGYRPPAPLPPVPPPPNPYKRPIRQNTNIVCAALIVLFVLIYTLPTLLVSLMDATGASSLPTLVLWLLDILLSIVSFVLPIIFIAALTGIPARVAFPMRGARADLIAAGTFLCLGVSIVGQFITMLISAVLTQVIGATPYMGGSGPPMGGAELAAYAVSYTVIPAVLEELLFRGVILQTLRRYGDGFALVTSSILFALTHGNLVQAPNAFLLGLVIGYFVLRTGSLLPGMIFHFVNNALVVVLMVLEAAVPAWGGLINALFYPVYLLLGLIGLFWLRFGLRVDFQLMPSNYPLREKTKYGQFFSSGCALLYLIVAAALTIYHMVW